MNYVIKIIQFISSILMNIERHNFHKSFFNIPTEPNRNIIVSKLSDFNLSKCNYSTSKYIRIYVLVELYAECN